VNRPGKALKRLLILLVVLIVLVGGWAYVQASSIPDEYRPAQLDSVERGRQADHFWKTSMADFNNGAQNITPFAWSISADRLNEYLASIDAIASANPAGSARPGEIDSMMNRAGLSEPAVAFADGTMTLMVRSTEYGKVLSVDLSVDKSLSIRTEGTRVGKLALPDKVGQAALDKLKDQIAGGDGEGVLAELILGNNEEPIPTDWTYDKKDIRITGVRITDEGITVEITPTNRGSGGGPTVSTDFPPGFIPESR